MAKKDDHKALAIKALASAVQKLDWHLGSGSQSLSKEQVVLRKAKCEAKNICFISLKAGSEEAPLVEAKHPVAGSVMVLNKYAA